MYYLQVSVSTQGDEGESDVPSPVTITITCPACRTPIPLPQGGIAYLQVRLSTQQESNGLFSNDLMIVLSVGFSYGFN